MSESLLQKLKNGKIIYGTCIVSTSPVWSKVVTGCNLDFVFLDTEHIPLDRTELTFLCQTYNALEISSIVRIPGPDPFEAVKAKDAGAIGVIAPYVESVDQIREMVGAAKYRPLKGKRLQNVLSGKEKLNVELQTYLDKFNKDSMCIVNIESMTAVHNLDDLLNVHGLDAVIIGPHDLSISMDLPEQYEHPEYEKVVKEIIHKARKKGIAAGIHFPADPDRQIKWMNEGANIILHSSDMFLFSQKLKEDIGKIKNASGERPDMTDESNLAI
jgi:4-hydroxy-2-oxoheptanedioate aldolase